MHYATSTRRLRQTRRSLVLCDGPSTEPSTPAPRSLDGAAHEIGASAGGHADHELEVAEVIILITVSYSRIYADPQQRRIGLALAARVYIPRGVGHLIFPEFCSLDITNASGVLRYSKKSSALLIEGRADR